MPRCQRNVTVPGAPASGESSGRRWRKRSKRPCHDLLQHRGARRDFVVTRARSALAARVVAPDQERGPAFASAGDHRPTTEPPDSAPPPGPPNPTLPNEPKPARTTPLVHERQNPVDLYPDYEQQAVRESTDRLLADPAAGNGRRFRELLELRRRALDDREKGRSQAGRFELGVVDGLAKRFAREPVKRDRPRHCNRERSSART